MRLCLTRVFLVYRSRQVCDWRANGCAGAAHKRRGPVGPLSVVSMRGLVFRSRQLAAPTPPRGRADRPRASRPFVAALLLSACKIVKEQRRSIATRRDRASAHMRRARAGVGAANCRERNTNPLMETATRAQPISGAQRQRRDRASALMRRPCGGVHAQRELP
jgi:hypothetical protein